jgi:hypothetical protein
MVAAYPLESAFAPSSTRSVDVADMLARGIDVARLRAMGFDDGWIATACDDSLPTNERLRALGFEDEGPGLTLRTPEEIEAFFADDGCAPST